MANKLKSWHTHAKRKFAFYHTKMTLTKADLSNIYIYFERESRRTIYSYFDFGLKNSCFRLPYQRPSSSADCARELFKGSNGSASLVDCT